MITTDDLTQTLSLVFLPSILLQPTIEILQTSYRPLNHICNISRRNTTLEVYKPNQGLT